jgi:methylated-DNA-[protein]-cysteine S-methyltransferase
MTEPVSTYYHSPVGVMKISGTDEYISEVSFHDTTEIARGRKKNLPPLIIHCLEQLIQYFNGE